MAGYAAERAKEIFLRGIKENDIIIIYDLETTGLSPVNNHIIQLSARACLIADDCLQEIGGKSWYINPGYPLDSKIVELTGITDDFLRDKPMEADVFLEIKEYFGNYAVCGYNNNGFDDKFMQNMYERYGEKWAPVASLDLYPVASRCLYADQLANFKLATVTEYFGHTEKIKAFHNAEGDTLATELVFTSIMGLCLNGKEKKDTEYTSLLQPTLVSVNYWKGGGTVRPRIYVDTKVGNEVVKFWIDPTSGIYHKVDKTPVDPYDINYLEKQVLDDIKCDYKDYRGDYRG